MTFVQIEVLLKYRISALDFRSTTGRAGSGGSTFSSGALPAAMRSVAGVLRRLAPQSLFIRWAARFASRVPLSSCLFDGGVLLSRYFLGGRAFCVLRAPQSLFVRRARVLRLAYSSVAVCLAASRSSVAIC